MKATLAKSLPRARCSDNQLKSCGTTYHRMQEVMENAVRSHRVLVSLNGMAPGRNGRRRRGWELTVNMPVSPRTSWLDATAR